MAVPAALVNAESVTKSYGTRTLLDAVSLGVAAGERVGVVGRNGDGKSTLLRLLAGDEPPDAGRVTHATGLRVGRLRQHDDLDPAATVRLAALGDRAEHAWAADPRAREIVGALLGELALDGPVGSLSGGERRRVSLARLLVDDPDLLLLDEPTNHLDVTAVDWLARHLAGSGGGLVVVTHDRWLLDAVTSRIWEVHGGAVRAFDGGYAAYVLARAERERIAAADAGRRQSLLRKELAWLRRGPPARTSKPRFRIEAANRLIADVPPARDRLQLQRFATARLGRTVLELSDVTVALPGGRTLLDRITWDIGPGDRIGLLGRNGTGKTTLLRVLAGEVAPTSGAVVTGRTVVPAHLSQQVAELDPDLRALEAAEQVRRVVVLGDGREATAAQLLERFGFTGDRPWTRVGELSGGERRRLQLLRLLMAQPNVLLLDEPTNDLDVETLQVIEDLLDTWPGTLVVVSHDRWFLERVTDEVYALPGDGRLLHLPGGVEEFLALPPARGLAAEAPDPAGDAPEEGRLGGADLRTLRRELVRIERELARLEPQEARLHDLLAGHATEHARVQALDQELRDLLVRRERLEQRWLDLAERLP